MTSTSGRSTSAESPSQAAQPIWAASISARRYT